MSSLVPLILFRTPNPDQVGQVLELVKIGREKDENLSGFEVLANAGSFAIVYATISRFGALCLMEALERLQYSRG
jgi:hypothetical protein